MHERNNIDIYETNENASGFLLQLNMSNPPSFVPKMIDQRLSDLIHDQLVWFRNMSDKDSVLGSIYMYIYGLKIK